MKPLLSAGDPETVLSLAGAAYEAALEPARWHTFLERFGQALHSPMCLIWAHDFRTRTADLEGRVESLGLNIGVDDSALASFNAHYHKTNVWLQNPALHRAGTVVHGSQLFDDALLTQTEWYADWLRHQDMFYSCAAVVEHEADRSFNVTALRARQLGAYSPQELQMVEQLIPHLKTAFALHRKLQHTQTLAYSSLAVLERLPLGVVLLNAEGHFLLRIQGQQMQATWAQDQSWLELTIGQCARTAQAMAHTGGRDFKQSLAMGSLGLHSGDARRMQHMNGRNLHVMVSPMPLAAQPYGVPCGVLMLLSDPSRILTSLVHALQQFYRLTRAEAKLVQALINGLSPQEYADSAALSINTVRTQFKAAAAKVGVSRQADLVRVVLMGPALLRWEQAQDAAQ